MHRDVNYLLIALGLILILFISSALVPSIQPDHVDFSQDIRPILNKHCLKCHGGVRQNGGLSFLFQESAFKITDSGKQAIIPGDVHNSEMYKRITSQDPDEMMPPEGDRLTKDEIATLERWISQGANWNQHWSYKPILEQIDVPTASKAWTKNEIDAFIWTQTQKNGLMNSPEASPEQLIRRLSLDLIGLPPTWDLVDAYRSGELTYVEIVDHLLQSENYGEKWASMWMDLARYADSQGYQKDLLRPTMWVYRDWVIHAFNTDMPFDQFTIEQLAGDLLPNPTDQQILATAFHRNTMTNDEGGTEDEEYRVAAVMDRVNTTYEVWQATTMACVQCHTHPYDPILHDEYYEVYATFNNTADQDHSRDLPLANLISEPMEMKHNLLQLELEEMREEGDTTSLAYAKSLNAYMQTLPKKVPVMMENTITNSRKTNLFERGNWLVHGKEVKPDLPQFLSQGEPPLIENRLDLAKWLIDPNNPLTARVIVNRIWEQIFGKGLVETVEDFGTQGSPPSHPQLLDWLAYRLMHDHQWHIKPLIRDIVTSATYRQSSVISDQALQKDPANVWLSRGPRIRLTAEQIRDQALAVSGLLNNEPYGPSIMPYQPDGVWNSIRHVAKWEESTSGKNYKRGLYTFWRRVSPYPSMTTFDTPSRELCVSRRVRTNTPLQALVILNDPVYVHAAQHLTWNTFLKDDPETSITKAYESVLFKKPDEFTLGVLSKLYKESHNYLLKNVDSNNPCSDEDIAFEALYNVVSSILNLDEVIMKG